MIHVLGVRCLYCGLCYEKCPVQAIESKVL